MGTGSSFGEIDLLFYNDVRKYSYMAIKDCELYVLLKKNFKSCFLREFRDIGDEFLQISFIKK
jgi:CRP-like cAMP-binding protein